MRPSAAELCFETPPVNRFFRPLGDVVDKGSEITEQVVFHDIGRQPILTLQPVTKALTYLSLRPIIIQNFDPCEYTWKLLVDTDNLLLVATHNFGADICSAQYLAVCGNQKTARFICNIWRVFEDPFKNGSTLRTGEFIEYLRTSHSMNRRPIEVGLAVRRCATGFNKTSNLRIYRVAQNPSLLAGSCRELV
ncbi:hypothetical protein LV28_22835 [Pandoraea pnomenusa]|nr:hypothetical protein LV28_22835 [Pandoraea pnomenusa]